MLIYLFRSPRRNTVTHYTLQLLSDDGPRASDMSPGHRAPAQLLNVGRGRATGPTLYILHILLTVHPQPQPMCLQGCQGVKKPDCKIYSSMANWDFKIVSEGLRTSLCFYNLCCDAGNVSLLFRCLSVYKLQDQILLFTLP